MNLEDVVRKIEAGELAAPSCFHCGRRDPEFTNAYVPTPLIAKRLGQPAGKQRIMIYGVCEPCMTKYGKAEIMEMAEQDVLRKRGIH